MNNSEEVIAQIKILCSSVTEDSYNVIIQRCHKLLSKLCDLGLERESVYQILLEYYNNLEDGITSDCVADVLDFIVGWCSPQKRIWKD
ncbi:MAG: hypothetical protein K2K56_02545 [Lachnospiraceae bacterium]|nr:hypothetical protein [Lachnospiraceae bacterium]